MIDFMNKSKEPNTIIKYFKSLDKREKKVRNRIDTYIKTGMIDMIKKEVDKKDEETKTNAHFDDDNI